MLARERQSQILSSLHARGAVAVAQLADQLAVTDETIRRDLAKLADEGLLVRTHGGAVQPDPDGRDAPFTLRRVQNAEAKRAIARLAAAYVDPGDVVGIDASTTGFELARQIASAKSKSPLTVVSNGLDVARVLAGREGVRVVSTGGELDAEGGCFVGPIAEAAFRRFALTKAFLSCKAFDPERGPSEDSPAHAAIKQTMLSIAETSYLLVDSTKIGKRATCFVAGPESFAETLSEPSDG